jgi:hypothetical protein
MFLYSSMASARFRRELHLNALLGPVYRNTLRRASFQVKTRLSALRDEKISAASGRRPNEQPENRAGTPPPSRPCRVAPDWKNKITTRSGKKKPSCHFPLSH